jgi:hypothetical protein
MSAADYHALPWTPVESSNLSRVAFVPADGTGVLYVEFGPGRIYRYAEVPADLHQELLDAESVGSFFSSMIRDEYDTTRLIVA